MVPLVVVVLDVLADKEPQVTFSKHDHATQALFLDRPDEPLGIGVQVRASRRQLDRRDTAVLQYLVKRLGE